jgi:hypothetical protein
MKKLKFSIAVAIGMIPIGMLAHFVSHSPIKDNPVKDVFFVIMLALVARFITAPIISFIFNKLPL